MRRLLALAPTLSLVSWSGSASSNPFTAPVETMLDLFMPIGFLGGGFVGSVVDAHPCATTIGIACTANTVITGSTWYCHAFSTLYATYGPGKYAQETSEALVPEQTCTLLGTTAATCSVTLPVGIDTSSATGTTLTGTDVVYRQIPITAGASKLSNVGACAATGNAAVATAIPQVFKVLIMPGAAAVLAGALV